MSVLVDETNFGFFWANLQVPRDHPPRRVASPREDLPPYILGYSLGAFSPKVPLRAGSWVKVGDVIYECITSPRNKMWSQIPVGQEVQILPLSDVYPLRCAIVPKGTQGNPLEDIPIAIWSPTEDTRDHGSYVSYSAYVPVTEHEEIDINSEVVVGTKRYMITREGLDVSTGVVQLTLRGSGRG